MEDRRFDSLTKSLASGANRRSVLKGLLGLGGGAAIGGTELEGDANAARRPTPTPKPIRCPGVQQWDGAKCVCPSGMSQCNPGSGPDCCNDNVPAGPGYSECCDNACCHYPGQCVGEERCCPRLPEIGCLAPDGECCTTHCGITQAGVECCPSDEFCPGGPSSDDLCCSGDISLKCDCGTDNNRCLPDIDEACCVAADCDTPPLGWVCNVTATCDDHVCHYQHCGEEASCCPDGQGGYACRAGSDACCLTNEQCTNPCEICGPDWVCIDDPDSYRCGSDSEFECCPNGQECSDAGECCAVAHSACGPNCCDPQSQTPQCCNGACVAADVQCCNADHPCDGECETCVDGACQADPGACLSCQECQFDPATNSNMCVNACPGCDSCFADGCRPDDSQCAAPATCCGWSDTCVDLTLANACCVDTDCDQPPDACSTGTCGANNMCTYASNCAGGTCCADGFCTDGPNGCCGDSDCPAIGCSASTCAMQSHTCAYAPNHALCGSCGICASTGECVAGTCSGWCEVCRQNSATGPFNCQTVSGCCPPYMVPFGDTCANACVLLLCPEDCWCAANSNGTAFCVRAMDYGGACQSSAECPSQFPNCLYSEAYGHPICTGFPARCLS